MSFSKRKPSPIPITTTTTYYNNPQQRLVLPTRRTCTNARTIFTAIFRSNESESFLDIKPFDTAVECGGSTAAQAAQERGGGGRVRESRVTTETDESGQ